MIDRWPGLKAREWEKEARAMEGLSAEAVAV